MAAPDLLDDILDDLSNQEHDDDDEEDDDEEEDEEEDEESEEEEEPKLKYQRLGSTVADLLKEDVATAMYAHDKFLALGTKRGGVAILDFNGNMTHNYRPHMHAIRQICVDTTGEYIGEYIGLVLYVRTFCVLCSLGAYFVCFLESISEYLPVFELNVFIDRHMLG